MIKSKPPDRQFFFLIHQKTKKWVDDGNQVRSWLTANPKVSSISFFMIQTDSMVQTDSIFIFWTEQVYCILWFDFSLTWQTKAILFAASVIQDINSCAWSACQNPDPLQIRHSVLAGLTLMEKCVDFISTNIKSSLNLISTLIVD